MPHRFNRELDSRLRGNDMGNARLRGNDMGNTRLRGNDVGSMERARCPFPDVN